MASDFAAPFAVLCLAISALELFSFMDQQPSGGRTTAPAQQASLLHSAAEVMPPLVALSIAIAFIHHRLSHAAVPAAGVGNRRLSGLVFFVLCVSIGTLESILFVQGAGTGADRGAQALRALGLAALRALPAAAAGAFFLGTTMILHIVVTHVRAGGEGGGGDALVGDGPIQVPVRLLTKVTSGVAAALAFLMVMALYGGSK